ncbi:MAG: hypothetical protein KGM24_09910, partial [Elusimicrobia bacterium]|nr:hypothetical protein [Elusimicrobiota bacterium]
LAETAAVVAVLTAALAAGPALMSAVPGVAFMASLLVPFQVLAGFGFTYMMYAQLRKMDLERSAGDSSSGMMWAFLGTKTIWVWSFATMLSQVSGPLWLVLPAGAAFAGLCWTASRAALSRLLRASWSFLPERASFAGRTLSRRALADAAAFAALAALIGVLCGAGWLLFAGVFSVAPATAPLFAMYLIYTVQNLVACVATLKSLRLQTRLGRAARP